MRETATIKNIASREANLFIFTVFVCAISDCGVSGLNKTKRNGLFPDQHWPSNDLQRMLLETMLILVIKVN